MSCFGKKWFSIKQVIGLATVIFLVITVIASGASEINSELNPQQDAIYRRPRTCIGNGPNDVMVRVGSLCVDKYEASVWSNPLVGTGIQYGATADDYPCSDNGNDCTGANAIYAVSMAGVTPSRYITWFQAQQACAASGKRLLTSTEWQMAAAGTPDSTTCNVSTGVVANTGSFSGCVSNHQVNDMVGNLWEWVADWVPASTICPGWGFFSDDIMCLSGASTTATYPGVIIRGGDWNFGASAGVFAIVGTNVPWTWSDSYGFRCGR